MQSLLDKLRSSDDENLEESVMSRLDWLNYLCKIYNLTACCISIQPSSSLIKTEAFLNTLIENITNFPLVKFENYNQLSSVKCISFKEIFQCFETDFGKILS